MKKTIINSVISQLDELKELITSSETITEDIPVMIKKTDEFIAGVDCQIEKIKDDKRLAGEINRCARNLTAMKLLYFQRLDGTDATQLAITPEEIKERLTGWIDILVQRLKIFLEQ